MFANKTWPAACLPVFLILGALAARNSTAFAGDTITITVNPSHEYGRIHKDVLGVNSSTRYDGVAQMKVVARTFASIGVTGSRWPGGRLADVFDWRGAAPRYCETQKAQPHNTDGTFEAYMHELVIPSGLSPELTVNYATSGTGDCAAPGDPAVAAQWVHFANVERHYGIKWWEVGNESYELGEADSHPSAHDPRSYAQYEPAFYDAMKAADPNILVGVPVTAGVHDKPTWDENVIGSAKFDYVAFHYYPTFYPHISDDRLLRAPLEGHFAIAPIMRNLRDSLRRAGKCGDPCAIPISVSEWNSVSHNPTAQTLTIVEGLFAAETLGEFFNAGVSRAEFWVDHGCQDNTPGRSGYGDQPLDPIYGWQSGTGNQGMMTANGIPDSLLCPHAGFNAPPGTVFPSGRALQLYAQSGFATEGASAVSSDSTSGLIKSFASYDAESRRVVVMVINLDQSQALPISVAIDGMSGGSSCKSIVYSKAIYDKTQNGGPWDPPSTQALGSWSSPFRAVVPPWSMTAYTFSP